MTAPTCPHPIVIHRTTGAWECPDSLCSESRDAHTTSLPCRWSWPYAHSRAWGGRTFPAHTCPHCAHIRRAGKPQIPIAPAMQDAQAAARAAP